jgi:hypothetical protein
MSDGRNRHGEPEFFLTAGDSHGLLREKSDEQTKSNGDTEDRTILSARIK